MQRRWTLPRQRKKELKRHATDEIPARGHNVLAMSPTIWKWSGSCSCESLLARVASTPVVQAWLLIGCHFRVATPQRASRRVVRPVLSKAGRASLGFQCGERGPGWPDGLNQSSISESSGLRRVLPTPRALAVDMTSPILYDPVLDYFCHPARPDGGETKHELHDVTLERVRDRRPLSPSWHGEILVSAPR
jgi:hypothetical protein